MHKRTMFLKVKLEENIYYDNSIRKYIFVVMLRIQKKSKIQKYLLPKSLWYYITCLIGPITINMSKYISSDGKNPDKKFSQSQIPSNTRQGTIYVFWTCNDNSKKDITIIIPFQKASAWKWRHICSIHANVIAI